MSSLTLGFIVFACVFGGAMLGMLLRGALPEHHLNSESKDVVKQAMGLIATMAALLLGLLVASAKSSYDTQKNEVADLASKIGLLDFLLAAYGPESEECRGLLHDITANTIDLMWHADGAPVPPSTNGNGLYLKIQALTPKTDAQRAVHAQISGMTADLGKTRWLMYAQSGSSISRPLLVMMVCWLSIVLTGFGLFAPRNPTVIFSLLLCALSVSGAIFLILEMDKPFTGIIQISDAPLRTSLARIGR